MKKERESECPPSFPLPLEHTARITKHVSTHPNAEEPVREQMSLSRTCILPGPWDPAVAGSEGR